MNEITPLEELENEPTDSLIETSVEEIEIENPEDEDVSSGGDELEQEGNEVKDANPPKANKGNRFSKKIQRQHWENQELKRELAKEREITKSFKEANRIKERPDIDNYDSHESYQQDTNKYNDQQVNARAQEIVEQERGQARQREANRQINQLTEKYVVERSKVTEVDSNYREYEKSVDEAPEIQNAILKGGGTAMVQHFGKNPDVLEDIALMSPQDRLFELGKIANKVKAKTPKKVSSAPNPTSSDRGSARPNGNGRATQASAWAERCKKINKR